MVETRSHILLFFDRPQAVNLQTLILIITRASPEGIFIGGDRQVFVFVACNILLFDKK